MARKVAKGIWILVKWVVGTLCGIIAFLEFAPRYEQLKANGWSWFFQLPLSSSDIIGIAAITVALVLIGWDILSRLRARTSRKVKLPETVPVALDSEKLRALSPIHMMIMAIERVSPREASFGPYTGDGMGRVVPFDTPNLNLDKVRSAFSDHAAVLGNHHLKEWLKFDEQIRECRQKGGFWVGRSEWKWFDELEREYQDTRNANLPQTAPEIEVKRREFNESDVGPPIPLRTISDWLSIPNVDKILTDWLRKKLPDFCNVQVKEMDSGVNHGANWSEVRGIVQDSDLLPYHFTLHLDSKGKIDKKKSYVN